MQNYSSYEDFIRWAVNNDWFELSLDSKTTKLDRRNYFLTPMGARVCVMYDKHNIITRVFFSEED